MSIEKWVYFLEIIGDHDAKEYEVQTTMWHN